jgi:hypothetical protein
MASVYPLDDVPVDVLLHWMLLYTPCKLVDQWARCRGPNGLNGFCGRALQAIHDYQRARVNLDPTLAPLSHTRALCFGQPFPSRLHDNAAPEQQISASSGSTAFRACGHTSLRIFNKHA